MPHHPLSEEFLLNLDLPSSSLKPLLLVLNKECSLEPGFNLLDKPIPLCHQIAVKPTGKFPVFTLRNLQAEVRQLIIALLQFAEVGGGSRGYSFAYESYGG